MVNTRDAVETVLLNSERDPDTEVDDALRAVARFAVARCRRISDARLMRMFEVVIEEARRGVR